jgi:hypothetical protein
MMVLIIVAFFIAAGVLAAALAIRLVGVRQAPWAVADVNIEGLSTGELEAVLRNLVGDIGDLRARFAEAQREVQQLREMMLGVRLESRRAMQKAARREADLQQGLAYVEVRLRHVESDRGRALLPARRERLRRLPATAVSA